MKRCPGRKFKTIRLSKLPSYLEYLKQISLYEKRLSSIASKDIKTMDDLKKIPFNKTNFAMPQADSDRKNPFR